MRYLDQLLKGVEWKNLGELTNVLRGRRLTRNSLSSTEKYPVYHGGLEPLGFYSDFNRLANTVMIINVGASAGTVGYSSENFWSSDGCYCIEHSKVLNSKFLYYFLIGAQHFLKSRVRMAGIPTLDSSVIKSLRIPIPYPEDPKKSFEIQAEIVRILDTFTDLTRELTTELTARKQQYSYYLNELFNPQNEKVERKMLFEIGEFQRGKRFVRTDIVSEGIPCIHYGEMYTHYGTWATKSKSFLKVELVENRKLRIAEEGDVVIVAAGETIEEIGMGTAWLGNEGVVVHDACFSYRSSLNPRYVAYFTRTKHFHDQIKKHISSGKISAINAKGLGTAIIPILPAAEQERIVNILDKFDTLTTSKNEGLPKEIKLRKKQYEYYRELLFKFPNDKLNA
jgi:type I restriction enzyme S subunit